MTRVSVIMPLGNARPFVLGAVQSILSQFPSLELLIVDQSNDGSSECVRALADPRISLIAHSRGGISEALNAGLAEATGSIIMRCDADDLYTENRIVQQIEWLKAHPDYDAVCGSFSAIDEADRLVTDFVSSIGVKPKDITEELRRGSTPTHLCTYAMRAELVRRTGDFRRYFETGEDLDYQLRLAEHGRIWYVPEDWYHYRIHSASMTHSTATSRRLFFERAAREFQEQRVSQGQDALEQGEWPEPPVDEEKCSAAARLHRHGLLLGKAWTEHAAGQRLKALATGMRSLHAYPWEWAAWKSLVALAVKPRR